MNLLYGVYRALASGALFSCLPPFWAYARLSGRHGRGLRERLGLLPPDLVQQATGSPRLWLHAASLGEVKVAGALKGHLQTLLPGCSILLSTTTPHGKEMGQRTFQDHPVFYAPIDAPYAVRKALSSLKPHAMIFLETEIWPTWIMEARRMGVRTALVNGRISARSFRGYLRLRPFFRRVLGNMDAFSMILPEDADRIRAMGAEPWKIEVNGNAKYEILAQEADPAVEEEMRRILNLGPSQIVMVAGSTRGGEEEMILDAYRKISDRFPDAVLVIAPRHITRIPQIRSLLRARGLGSQLRTELGPEPSKRVEPVVLLNTFGELFRMYALGTINFCGGSLVPLGGQNPLEPAAWGKLAFYGPSMEDFLDAKALLEPVGAGIEVSGPEELAERAVWFLENPHDLSARGARGKDALLRNRGAAERHARVVAGLLERGIRTTTCVGQGAENQSMDLNTGSNSCFSSLK